MIKIRAEINEIEPNKYKRSMNPKAGSLKINEIDKSSTRLIKKNWEKTQINKIRNERGEIITDTREIQRILRKYYDLPVYAKNLDNLEEKINS